MSRKRLHVAKKKEYEKLKILILAKAQELPKDVSQNREDMIRYLTREVMPQIGTKGYPKVLNASFIPYYIDRIRKEGVIEYDKDYQEWVIHHEALTKFIEDKMGITEEAYKTKVEQIYEELMQSNIAYEKEKAKKIEEEKTKVNEQEVKEVHEEDPAYEKFSINFIKRTKENNKSRANAIRKAQAYQYDYDFEFAKDTNNFEIASRFTIHKEYDIFKADYCYELYKEIYYISDEFQGSSLPHNYVVLREIIQKGPYGDEDWALRLAEHEGLTIID